MVGADHRPHLFLLIDEVRIDRFHVDSQVPAVAVLANLSAAVAHEGCRDDTMNEQMQQK
jgi:hypothetical protein